MPKFTLNFHKKQKGATLVSLMVGLVLSLLIGVCVMGSLQVYTAQQKQATGISGVSVSAQTVLNNLKYEIAQTGRGLVSSNGELCSGLNFAYNGTLYADGVNYGSFIYTESKTGEPSIQVMYAHSVESSNSAKVVQLSAAGLPEISGYLPAAVNDAVMLKDGNTGICEFRSIASFSSADSNTALTFKTSDPYNKGVTFTTPVVVDNALRIFPIKGINVISITKNGTNLNATFPLLGTTGVLLKNVQSFSVKLGVSDGITNTISNWIDPVKDSSTGIDWSTLTGVPSLRVKAIKIGLLMKSPQKEKMANGVCTVTTTYPTLFDKTIKPAESDWGCYRYRSFQVVIPLKNLGLAAQGV